MIQFPEFVNASEALVNAMLTAAAEDIDPFVWGTKTDQGTGYLAAHKLAQSPYGQNVRLNAKDGNTTYLLEYERIKRQVVVGAAFVAGAYYSGYSGTIY